MAIETHVHDGTAYRKLKSWYAHDGSAWRDLKKVYCHDGTDWRQVFRKGYWEPIGTLSYPKRIKKIGGTISASCSDGVWGLSGDTWSRIGDITGSCYDLADVSDVLHVAGNYTGGGVFYWNGSSWVRLGVSGEVSGSLAYVSGRLISGIQTRGTPAREWNGSNWANMGTSPTNVFGDFCVNLIDGEAYASQYLDGIWKLTGNSWSRMSGGSGSGTCIVKIDGALYGAFSSTGTCYWDGSSWQTLGSGIRTSRMKKINNMIYSPNTANGSLAGVCYWDGSSWTKLGVGSNTDYANDVTEIDDYIWAAFWTGARRWSIPISEM